MKWFIAKLVFQIIQEEGKVAPQFDEQLRLIMADHPAEAFAKSQVFGRNEEVEFSRGTKDRVKWTFVAVAELIPLQDLKDGMELYSFSPENPEAGHYLNFIKLKSEKLQESLVNTSFS